MKFSKLLQYLLAPFFMMAVEDGAGGAAGDEDRGDGGLASGADDLHNEEVPDPLKAEKDAATAAAITAAAKAAGKPEAELTEQEREDAAAAALAAETEGGDKKAGKDTRIPLSRHKELLNAARAERDEMAAQLAQFQRGTEVAQVNQAIADTEAKLLALEGEYNKLLVEGDAEKAAAKMTEIRLLERSIGEQKTVMATAAAEARTIERMRYDEAVNRIEAAFPKLNRDHDDYDKEVEAEVMDLVTSFKRSGATPTAALQRAVKYVLGADTSTEKKATEVKPKVTAEEVAAERKREALARNAKAAVDAPASTSKAGMNSDQAGGVLTIEKVKGMSQSDFAKIDEKELARLRGDEVEA